MRRCVSLALLGLMLLALPACFDYEAQLTLKPDGSGQVSFSLVAPAAYHLTWDEPLLRRIFAPQPVALGSRVEGEKQYFTEQVDFKFLGNLKLSRLAWSMVVTDTGLLGVTDYTYKLTTVLVGAENIPPATLLFPTGFERKVAKLEPWQEGGLDHLSAAEALRLRVAATADHHITIIQNLPGTVQEADKIVLGNHVVEPQINGNTVSWRIPLAQLVAGNVRSDLQFSCSFQGEYEPSERFRPAWASRLH